MVSTDPIRRAGIEGLRAISLCLAAAGRLPHGAVAAGIGSGGCKRTSAPIGAGNPQLINLAPVVAGVSRNTHSPFLTTNDITDNGGASVKRLKGNPKHKRMHVPIEQATVRTTAAHIPQ
ncbi:hypothetical protein [Burkholderia stagnalis]